MQEQDKTIRLNRVGVETFVGCVAASAARYSRQSKEAEDAGELSAAKFYAELAHYYEGQSEALRSLLEICKE